MDWGQEEKGMTENEMAGWHHWLNECESEWTPGVGDGQGGLACCNSWGHKNRTWLNDWTELNWTVMFTVRHWPKYFIQYFIIHICHWQLFVTPIPISFSFSNASQFYLTYQNLRNAISRNISRKHSMEYTRCILGSLRSTLKKQSTMVKETEKTILREQVQKSMALCLSPHCDFLSIVTRYVWI